MSSAEIDAASSQLAAQLMPQSAMRSFALGGATGLTLSGLLAMAQTLRKAKGKSISYTSPMDVPIYIQKKDEEESKKASVEAQPSLADLWSSQLHTPGGGLASILALTGGVGAGLWAGDKLTGLAGSISRKSQLNSARAEFEQALQSLAADEEIEEPKRKRKSRSKKASDPRVERLAANCQKIATWDIIPKGVKELALAYAALAPAVGAYYGFNNRWDQRKARDLSFAEQQVNQQRERSSPTFNVASLVDDRKTPIESTKSTPEDEKQEAREQVKELLQSEFAYLDD